MPPPRREWTRESACQAMAKFANKDDLDALDAICFTIDPDYPQATQGALKVLAEAAGRGNTVAVDGAASALCHAGRLTREIATEALEQLADRGSSAPASAAVATAFEGRWTGGLIKGTKIFWDDGGAVSTFELRSASTLSCVCSDAWGRGWNCWARLDAYGRLLWDYGAIWTRIETDDTIKQAALDGPTPSIRDVAANLELGPAKLTIEATEPAESKEELVTQEVDDLVIGDVYAVAAVAGHFGHEADWVREAAVQAIPKVAGKGCAAAVEALVSMLEDDAVRVRLAAVEALAMVAERGNPHAIEALQIRLEDQDQLPQPPLVPSSNIKAIAAVGTQGAHGANGGRPGPKTSPQGFGSGRPEVGDVSGGLTVGLAAARALKKVVASREELHEIVSGLRFIGPTTRGF